MLFTVNERLYLTTIAQSPGSVFGNMVPHKKKSFSYILFLFYLTDPNDVSKKPRHVIFVIDKSGSMNGTKMEQAKDAVMEWLQTMNPEQDNFQENYIRSFNLVMFDDSVNYWSGK